MAEDEPIEDWDAIDEDIAYDIFNKLATEHGDIGCLRIIPRIIVMFMDRYPHSIAKLMEEVANLVADEINHEQGMLVEDLVVGEELDNGDNSEGDDEGEP